MQRAVRDSYALARWYCPRSGAIKNIAVHARLTRHGDVRQLLTGVGQRATLAFSALSCADLLQKTLHRCLQIAGMTIKLRR
jgi:hypothetical protein